MAGQTRRRPQRWLRVRLRGMSASKSLAGECSWGNVGLGEACWKDFETGTWLYTARGSDDSGPDEKVVLLTRVVV